MKRYVEMLSNSMNERGHEVEIWKPLPVFSKAWFPKSIRKWFGYIDQFIIFQAKAVKRMKHLPQETLFVFTDHALGPWIHLARKRPHIIHCHDFLAQGSAKGEYPESPTGFTGRLYQAYIRNGYRKGQNFISVSNKTRDDLHKFLGRIPAISEVVYNGLDQSFKNSELSGNARAILGQKTSLDLSQGFLLHVGGNQWYKNRLGVIQLYNAFRKQEHLKLPLLMIGAEPSANLQKAKENSPVKEQIHFLDKADDNLLCLAYKAASLLLFPSLAEGFGWPIAEAMAAGCPVITTEEAPMTEVGGSAAFYIPRKSYSAELSEIESWTNEGVKTIRRVLSLSRAEKALVVQNGFRNTVRFEIDEAVEKIEAIYKKIANP